MRSRSHAFIQTAGAALVAVLSIAASASAAITIAAPEVEVKSVGAGLGVLAAGVLMMQARRNSRK
jgi:hypothetical protein